VIALLLALPAQAADSAAAAAINSHTPPLGAIPTDVLAVATAVSGRPLAERISKISGALLARPYVFDPMGEGALPDADPYARYDAYDCLTFAEEVYALALSGDPAHAADIRDALRYDDGPRDYFHRRHFMELQWIPGTIRAGLLRDTTREYGRTVAMDKDVGAATWAAWPARKNFAHTDAQLPSGHMHLDVLPLDEAVRVADQLRPGSLMLTVRVDKPEVPIWVTHVSLVVLDDTGKKVLRHATLVGDPQETRDHDIVWYLNHIRTFKSWPVLGVAVLEPVEQQHRRVVAP
jgi:Protein of unknown function (DUF1460)